MGCATLENIAAEKKACCQPVSQIKEVDLYCFQGY